MGRSDKVLDIKCLACKRDVRAVTSLFLSYPSESSRGTTVSPLEKRAGRGRVTSVGSGGHVGFGSGGSMCRAVRGRVGADSEGAVVRLVPGVC